MNRKPRVLIDVDGVLADFLTGALKVINQVTDGCFIPSDVTQWDIFESLELNQEIEDKCYEVFKSKNYAQNLRPYCGAKETIATLKEIADVFIVTSPIHSETWVHDRTEWLQNELGIGEKETVHTSAKYLISGDVLVDDRPENVRTWLEHNPSGVGILWGHSYNKDVDVGFRVENENWDTLISIVKLLKHCMVRNGYQ